VIRERATSSEVLARRLSVQRPRFSAFFVAQIRLSDSERKIQPL
jgi:hypothetical protein